MQDQELNQWRIVPCISGGLATQSLNPLSLNRWYAHLPHFVTISQDGHLSNADILLNFLFITRD
jgi:hypothetical protein